MADLTVQEGIVIQDQQLFEWACILKDEVREALVIYARKDNHLAKSGYDITRGTTLSNFVENFLYYRRTGRLEKELGAEGWKEYTEFLGS